MSNAYKILVGKFERRPLGKREDNIRMDLKEIVCEFYSFGSG
jgi:hypothetical protein